MTFHIPHGPAERVAWEACGPCVKRVHLGFLLQLLERVFLGQINMTLTQFVYRLYTSSCMPSLSAISFKLQTFSQHVLCPTEHVTAQEPELSQLLILAKPLALSSASATRSGVRIGSSTALPDDALAMTARASLDSTSLEPIPARSCTLPPSHLIERVHDRVYPKRSTSNRGKPTRVRGIPSQTSPPDHSTLLPPYLPSSRESTRGEQHPFSHGSLQDHEGDAALSAFG